MICTQEQMWSTTMNPLRPFSYSYWPTIFIQKKIEQAYCETDKQFLPDRFVEGLCPNCGAKAREINVITAQKF